MPHGSQRCNFGPAMATLFPRQGRRCQRRAKPLSRTLYDECVIAPRGKDLSLLGRDVGDMALVTLVVHIIEARFRGLAATLAAIREHAEALAAWLDRVAGRQERHDVKRSLIAELAPSFAPLGP